MQYFISYNGVVMSSGAHVIKCCVEFDVWKDETAWLGRQVINDSEYF